MAEMAFWCLFYARCRSVTNIYPRLLVMWKCERIQKPQEPGAYQGHIYNHHHPFLPFLNLQRQEQILLFRNLRRLANLKLDYLRKQQKVKQALTGRLTTTVSTEGRSHRANRRQLRSPKDFEEPMIYDHLSIDECSQVCAWDHQTMRHPSGWQVTIL